jgi:hypothetical protein
MVQTRELVGRRAVPPRPRRAAADDQAIGERLGPPPGGAYAVLAMATADAQSQGHALGGFGRSADGGRFVAACTRCGYQLPVIATGQRWGYPPPAGPCRG